jgi:hypothetical protein
MIKRYIILLLFVILASCEKSQDYNDILLKFYGDVYEDIGFSVAQVEGGYIIGGQLTEVIRDNNGIVTTSVSNKKMAIIKTNTDGNVIWKKTFGDPLTAVGSKILVLDDGSILCTGYVIDSLQKDTFVVKVDADGNNPKQLIIHSAGNQEGIDIIKSTGGFMVLGSTDVAGSGSSTNVVGKKDIYIRNISNNLELLSSPPNVGFPGNDNAMAIKADFNGGYIIAGITDVKSTDKILNDVFLLKVNAYGDYIDMKIFEGTRDEYTSDFEVTTDGYIIPVTVGAEGTTQTGYIMKVPTNISGTPVIGADITFSSALTISSFSLKAISAYKTNSFIIAGQSGTGSLAKMLVFAIGADGTLIQGKEKKIGGTGAQSLYDVITDADDNIIAVGKNSYETNSMISLLKFRF